jgi:hypothetical protein
VLGSSEDRVKEHVLGSSEDRVKEHVLGSSEDRVKEHVLGSCLQHHGNFCNIISDLFSALLA